MRPLLYNNIILVGGSSFFPGMTDRLTFELGNLSAGMKVKVAAPGNTVERRFSAWLGGSILASLGTFHQLWISKKEFEEYGANVVEKRCT